MQKEFFKYSIMVGSANSNPADAPAGPTDLRVMSVDVAGNLFSSVIGTGTNNRPARLQVLTASSMNPSPSNIKRGALLTGQFPEWALPSTPAVGQQATVTRAAVSGARHVCRSISATLCVDAADVAIAGVLVNLRDGTTGAGTILWSDRLAEIRAAGGVCKVFLAGLNIVGSVNTAMTLEFAAAPGAASFEAVSLSGFTIHETP